MRVLLAEGFIICLLVRKADSNWADAAARHNGVLGGGPRPDLGTVRRLCAPPGRCHPDNLELPNSSTGCDHRGAAAPGPFSSLFSLYSPVVNYSVPRSVVNPRNTLDWPSGNLQFPPNGLRRRPISWRDFPRNSDATVVKRRRSAVASG